MADLDIVSEGYLKARIRDYNSQIIVPIKSSIPTDNNQLTNGAGYITIDAVPTKVSELDNDSEFITEQDVPTKVSELTNDTGFITVDAVPTRVSELDNDSEFITIDTKVHNSENSDVASVANKAAGTLTINGEAYDGSTDVDVFIGAGGITIATEPIDFSFVEDTE